MKRFELYYGYKCPIGLHSWCSNALFLFEHTPATSVLAYCPAHGNPQVNTGMFRAPDRAYWIEGGTSTTLQSECHELDTFENWVNEVRKEAGL
jgi:hypothetical protein